MESANKTVSDWTTHYPREPGRRRLLAILLAVCLGTTVGCSAIRAGWVHRSTVTEYQGRLLSTASEDGQRALRIQQDYDTMFRGVVEDRGAPTHLFIEDAHEVWLLYEDPPRAVHITRGFLPNGRADVHHEIPTHLTAVLAVDPKGNDRFGHTTEPLATARAEVESAPPAAAGICPYKIVYVAITATEWGGNSVNLDDSRQISGILERDATEELERRGFVVVPAGDVALGMSVRVNAFRNDGSSTVVWSTLITSAALAHRWRLTRDIPNDPGTTFMAVAAQPSMRQARSTNFENAKAAADHFWRLAEHACQALESDREQERIAVESLRYELASEIVAARERQRQEKRLGKRLGKRLELEIENPLQ
jgi:hypothetical protein